MMLRDAIAEADRIRPNAVTDERKAELLERLEARFAEVQQVRPPAQSFPEDRELLMPSPADRAYVPWLCAMIDWEQLDMQLYQIDQAMFAEAYKDAVAWWRRHHIPVLNADGSLYRPGGEVL